MTNQRVKVLYIIGSGRNGSTLLANLLGSIDGFVSIGEIYYLWDRGLIENRRCGCGEGLRDCTFWQDILEDLGGVENVNGRTMANLRDSAVRTRHALRYLAAPRGGSFRGTDETKFGEALEQLYTGIAKHTGARVIVDSSKRPIYGYALGKIPAIDVFALHLVRDARAVSHSMMRRKRQPDKPGVQYLTRNGLVKSSVMWATWNTLAELLWRTRSDRYERLRYEDFVANPTATISRIAEFVGEEACGLDISDSNQVKLGLSHTVSGNPMRFDSGSTTIKADDAWKDAMSPLHRWASALLTWPQLLRYGYL